MQGIVQQIHTLLLQKKQTIAIAESCTGGLLSEMLTRSSGASTFFIFGAVVYSNLSKNRVLKIPLSAIKTHGAVSPVVAVALAKNIRRIAGTDYGIGITGIAGPTGGSKAKPVGTVFIAASGSRKTICREFRFKGNRNSIRRQAALAALGSLRTVIH